MQVKYYPCRALQMGAQSLIISSSASRKPVGTASMYEGVQTPARSIYLEMFPATQPSRYSSRPFLKDEVTSVINIAVSVRSIIGGGVRR